MTDITKLSYNLSPLLATQVATGAVTVDKSYTSLPESGAENTIYLIPDGSNDYLQYIWDGKWVCFGSTNGQGQLGIYQDNEGYLVIDQAPGLPRDSYTKEEIDSKLGEYTNTDIAHDNRIKAIEDDYLKDADKTALQEQITANTNAITLLTDGVDPVKIDGVKDLIEYVDEHGTEVTGMQDDITANADAISAEAARADAAEKALAGRVEALEAGKNAYVTADTALKAELKTYTDAAKAAAVETAKKYTDKTVDDNTAPPIVETVGGEAIVVHDSAERHPQSLFGGTVFCKNLLPYPYLDGDQVIKGIQFENGTNYLTLSGWIDGNEVKYLLGKLTLTAGDYTLSYVKNVSANGTLECILSLEAVVGGENLGSSFSIKDTSVVECYLKVYGVYGDASGGEGTVVLRVQLERGKNNTRFIQYSTEPRHLTRFRLSQEGENLWEKFTTSAVNGVTLTFGEDGAYILKGTCEKSGLFIVDPPTMLPAGTYSLVDYADGIFPNKHSVRTQVYFPDCWDDQQNQLGISLCTYNDENSKVLKTITINTPQLFQLRIRVAEGHTYDNCKLYPMFYKGGSSIPSPYNSYKTPTEWVIQEGLAGVQILPQYKTYANYNIENKTYIVSDEINLKNKQYIKRIKTQKLDGSENWHITNGVFYVVGLSALAAKSGGGVNAAGYEQIMSAKYEKNRSCSVSDVIYFANTEGDWAEEGITSEVAIARWKDFLSDNPIEICFVSKTPTIIPLTDEQISYFSSFIMNCPNSLITISKDASEEVTYKAPPGGITYVADTKLYIDNKFAELSAAILNQS